MRALFIFFCFRDNPKRNLWAQIYQIRALFSVTIIVRRDQICLLYINLVFPLFIVFPLVKTLLGNLTSSKTSIQTSARYWLYVSRFKCTYLYIHCHMSNGYRWTADDNHSNSTQWPRALLVPFGALVLLVYYRQSKCRPCIRLEPLNESELSSCFTGTIRAIREQTGSRLVTSFFLTWTTHVLFCLTRFI